MKKIISVVLCSLLIISVSSAQHRVKLLTYNVLNYPNYVVQLDKDTKFSLIFNEANPDIVAVQEILSQAAVNQFLNNTLGSSFSSATFFDGPDTDNALFYKDSIFTVLSAEIIPNTPRYITKYVLQHNFTQEIFVIFIAHFKAGSDPENEVTREQEAARLRAITGQFSQGTNYVLVGDLNLYRSTEPAYVRLLDQTNSGYFLDPVDRPGNWNNNSSFADVHTQSTRVVLLQDGGSNGGLDDRFDFILVSQALMNFGGVDYVEDSYWAYGNDGQHFNSQIVNPPYPISEQIAFALHDVSDHLPVIAEFDFGVVNNIEVTDPSLITFNLNQNYPNPFNPSTTISFSIPATESGGDQFVTLKIYDLLGREVFTLVNEEKSPGNYEVDFRPDNLPSGVYIYRLSTQEYSASKKLMIIK